MIVKFVGYIHDMELCIEMIVAHKSFLHHFGAYIHVKAVSVNMRTFSVRNKGQKCLEGISVWFLSARWGKSIRGSLYLVISIMNLHVMVILCFSLTINLGYLAQI